MRARLDPKRSDRVPWLAASALTIAVASGVLFFRLGGAPTSYAILNIVSLALALAMMFAVPAGRGGDRAAAWIVGLCLVGIGVTLVSGLDLDGVRRWLPLGPVRLHAALLFLPALVAALPRLPDRWQLAALILAAAIILAQPDFAAALALATGFIASHGRRWRSPLVAAGFGIVLLCAVASSFRTDPLAAVPFVENVIADGWIVHPALGVLIFAATLFAIAAPRLEKLRENDSALGVSGAWLGFTCASLVGAYPTPLVGYGAAAILGYGLSIAALRGVQAHK
jgi:hypothetical protein